MRELVRSVFIGLVAIFIYYLYRSNSHLFDFLYIHNFVNSLILVGIIVAAIWIAIRLETVISSIRFMYPIQLITSLFLVLFFIYQFFTPYFYTEQNLREVGLEKIETYYRLFDNDLSDNERIQLAEVCLTESMEFALNNTERQPKAKLLQVEVIDFKRNFYEYELTVEMQVHMNKAGELINEKKIYRYIFIREDWDFKISGWSELN